MNIVKSFEWVIFVNGHTGVSEEFLAKVDTGAYSSSIDEQLAERLGLEKKSELRTVRSALGEQERETVLGIITLTTTPVTLPISFSVADRSHLKYPILLGRKDLVGFLVEILEYKPKE